MKFYKITGLLLVPAIALSSLGCQRAYYSAYYKFWESLGREKRDLLVSELAKTNDEQDGLKKQLAGTLQRIRTQYRFDEGSVGKTYDSLSSDYQEADRRSKALHERVDAVRHIAEDLFREWKREANQIDDAPMRNASLSNLELSQAHFSATSAQLAEVEKKIQPVMKQMQNHVYFLKHELNARAVGSLETKLKSMAPEIEQLIRSLEQSIGTAKQFEKDMAQKSAQG